MSPTSIEQKNIVERPPVIVIMGHIDHGKSTLLDYIRKANTTAKEAGGITQRIAAYEVTHTTPEGRTKRITFIDTPGHEAFKTMRSCGAEVADIAVLVVSGEEGVKPQTIDAYKAIQASKTPMIVAINKMDRPGASVEKTKNSLLEHEIYVEGYGGSVPCVPISAKTGQGVTDLLDMMILLSDVEELKGDANAQGRGIVIESHLDKTRGISATVIVQNGTFKTGAYAVTETALAPLRIMQDYTGTSLKNAHIGTPIAIIGWDILPRPGSEVFLFDTKKQALAWQEEQNLLIDELKTLDASAQKVQFQKGSTKEEKTIIPLIIKAASTGIIDAVSHELTKCETDKVRFKIVSTGVGAITENDVKLALGKEGTLIVGFDVKIDPQAEAIRERENVSIEIFDIIYKLSEYITNVVHERTPKYMTLEETGRARILKIFNSSRKSFIIGGKVEKGSLKVGSQIKLLRRESEIGTGTIKELQQQKEKTREVSEGFEFGSAIECSLEPAPGDVIQAFIMISK